MHDMTRTAILSIASLLLFCLSPVAADPSPGDAVRIAPGDTMADIVRKAASVTPHPRQLAWQRLEFQAFIHYGVNAFTDREWGDGKEDPKLFNPTAFDADQWIAAFQAAGMRGVILTAKHHDGFCLWPSKVTDHSVKSSPWRNGKGDMVREVCDACRRAGLKFAVYLSPWDRHEPCYGDSPRYNAFFCTQLTELLTGYGEITEVWFDGACGEGPNGKRQVYDWDSYYALIRRLQPGAVISVVGPDVRWCGNEAGRTRESEWSVLPARADPASYQGDPAFRRLLVRGNLPDLGSRKILRNAGQLIWLPSQVNTSIRPGWFYHASQDGRVKSLQHLLDIYYGSVGGNAQFLLNLPPDQRGRIHENDVARLKELGDVLRATFKTNLAAGASVTVSQVRGGGRFEPKAMLDGNPDTCWMPEEGTEVASIELDLGAPRTFNRALLQEHLGIGQRIESHALDIREGAEWREVARATIVGYKRLLRFPDVTARKVRVRFLASRVCPTLSEFGLYREPVLLTAPHIARDRAGRVSLRCEPSGPQIRYTLDGTDPSPASPIYAAPFPLPRGGVVKAQAFVAGQDVPSAVTATRFDVCAARWKITHVDSDAGGAEAAARAIDGDPRTIWHTEYKDRSPGYPHEICVDLGETLRLTGFTYRPRTGGGNGTVLRYAFHASGDGKTWGPPLAEGEFANIKNNPVEQRIRFAASAKCRFIRLVGRSEVDGKPWMSVAELGVITANGP